ncbi:MAG: DUF2306 domain-containing protein [Pseudomonadota bacterium]
MPMHPEILLQAVPPIPGHAIAAIAATGLGVWQLFSAKRGRWHVLRGTLFVIALGYVALSGLFITRSADGSYSWIHTLIPVTLIGLFYGVAAVFSGNREGHGRSMTMLFVFALVVTGLFTFVPGRIMHSVVFGT